PALCYFLFLFISPATSYIYTLSLHDALPIYIIYSQDSYTGTQRVTGAELYRGFFGNRMLLGGYDVIYDTVGSNKTLHHALRWARDRKSTRLNSSHGSISYAVFCLKKNR